MSISIFTNRKSHTEFRLVPTSVTLNGPKLRNTPYFALFHRIRELLRPITSHLFSSYICPKPSYPAVARSLRQLSFLSVLIP